MPRVEMDHPRSVLNSTLPPARQAQRLRLGTSTTLIVSSSAKNRAQIWNPNSVSDRQRVPISLGDIFPDPEGTLESLGVLSPRDFWRFYHVEDVPDDPATKRMGRKWGELWLSYLVSDPVVLSGAVSLVLQKKAHLTQTNESESIHFAEMKALKLLRERLEAFDVSSLGGLIMSMCGRTQIAIQQGDLHAASLHLHAVKRLMTVHTLNGTEWLCSVWSDLRLVSSTGAAPTLPRYIPDEWRDLPGALLDSATESQYLALRNVRAFRTRGNGEFRLLYRIFQLLHQLEIATNNTSSQDDTSMQQIYETIYDCCLLHAGSREQRVSRPTADQLELVAICLKLCAWERASRCVPRGGEIERSLLQRALTIIQGNSNGCSVLHLPQIGVTSKAMLWMIFTLTATASAFAPTDMDIWIRHLKAVTQLSTPSTFKRALNGWPLAPWWLSRALNRICALMKPIKNSWEVLDTEQSIPLIAEGGMRLKLLVIEQ